MHRRTAAGSGRLAAIFLLSGLLFVAIGVVNLMAALRLDRPDAAFFMRKSIAMTIPLLVTGSCLMLLGTVAATPKRRSRQKSEQIVAKHPDRL